MSKFYILVLSLFCVYGVRGQENINLNKFRQLGQELPTPNMYRAASGAPGHGYYQQQADYIIKVTLNDENQRLSGTEKITYYNNSPDELSYLWLQLDQNIRAKDSDKNKIQTFQISNGNKADYYQFGRLHQDLSFDGGFNIEHVKDAAGENLHYYINKTMMRVDLPKPLASGETYVLDIKWWYNINDRMKIGGRSGYEYFKQDGNYLYTIAQFYPRMATYNEVEGWQHKQFLGYGEFALSFGDFEVHITAPEDHVIGATGELQNMEDVLTTQQINKLEEAKTAKEPVIIVSEDQARKAEKKRTSSTKTWVYKAKNVRDFAFASSRKFIWDAMGVKFGNRTVMAMSLYPKEGNPLWEQYSTKVVAHTLRTYSKYTFDYPYPVAYSIHAAEIGMEYPMICFNYGRPQPDGTYAEHIKNGMIGVIIHEVGHNYFPMIVNSDERQWTWMDEGLNTFLQYLTEQEWDRTFPSKRGPAAKIVDYMKGDKSQMVPIMTNSESIMQFGNNAYGKPATALNILRETVLGRELFDFAFKTYANRWKFKHPTPSDFFRTMEDASGTDLDWFWRGWFYTTDHVDMAIDKVALFNLNTKDPQKEKPKLQAAYKNKDEYLADKHNQQDIPLTVVESDESLLDFYSNLDTFAVSVIDREEYNYFKSSLFDFEKEAMAHDDYNYYEVKFTNLGGIPMPLIIEMEFEDGSSEIQRIPAEIWKHNHKEVYKVFFTKKTLVNIKLDPYLETADTDRGNNFWPPRLQPTRFDLFRNKEMSKRYKLLNIEENAMQRDKRAQKRAADLKD